MKGRLATGAVDRETGYKGLLKGRLTTGAVDRETGYRGC